GRASDGRSLSRSESTSCSEARRGPLTLGQRGGTRVQGGLVRRFLDELGRDEGRRHWREIHGPLGRNVPQIESYVQSHATQALGPVGPSDDPLAFDGYSCCWYADEESFLQSLRTPEWAGISADGPNLFDMIWL